MNLDGTYLLVLSEITLYYLLIWDTGAQSFLNLSYFINLVNADHSFFFAINPHTLPVYLLILVNNS